MEYSDWLQSQHSARVWLDNAMTAQCQFATIKPIKKSDELTVYYRFKGYDGTVGDDTDPNIEE